MSPLRILVGITYYQPYISGLTVYVKRLTSALAAQGHTVTILTSRYDPALPRAELAEGVRIVRVDVAARLSKAVLMPRYASVASRLLREHDIVNLHLPQPESTVLAGLAKFVHHRPCVITYHCDLNLPASTVNRAIDEAAFANNMLTGTLANTVVAYTDDYARHSRFLSRFEQKRRIIPPPVGMPSPVPDEVAALRTAHDLEGRTVIAFAARFATEKGVEIVVDALPTIEQALGEVRVLFAGPCENVIGEEAYYARLRPRVDALGARWSFLGVLNAQDLANCFAAADVTVLPSLNSTESFGMVQVESMLCGTPVCASNLPGVRVPVQTTGMGEIVPIGDAQALAHAVIRVVQNRDRYVRPRAEISSHFSIERTTNDYIDLFQTSVKQHVAAGAVAR